MNLLMSILPLQAEELILWNNRHALAQPLHRLVLFNGPSLRRSLNLFALFVGLNKLKARADFPLKRTIDFAVRKRRESSDNFHGKKRDHPQQEVVPILPAFQRGVSPAPI